MFHSFFRKLVDDATSLVEVEVLANDQKLAVIVILSRALAWIYGQGIDGSRVMSGNGPAYDFRALAGREGRLETARSQ